MPAKCIDYSKTVIYKLVCSDLSITAVYVGQTRDIRDRKHKHKAACNNVNDVGHNYYIYRFIRDNGGWINWQMVLVESYPCKDKDDAYARERHWVETLGASLNTCVPGRNNAKYYIEHADVIRERSRQYYIDNREVVNKKKKLYAEKNCDATKQYKAEWYLNHRDAINKQRRERAAEKRKNKGTSVEVN